MINMKKFIMMKQLRFVLITYTLFTVILVGCFPQVANFSPIAYEQSISLKVDSLFLIEKAVGQYDIHEKEVVELLIKIEKAYEYAKGRLNNEYTAQQWEILKDPERNLLGGFLKRWQENEQ